MMTPSSLPWQSKITHYESFVSQRFFELSKSFALDDFFHEASSYALLGGKRFRAALVYGAFELKSNKDSSLKMVDDLAMASEFFHAYTLIHDDLPCMDDSDERRNRPSLHKVFGEAQALLVGDALQSMSFFLIADSKLPEVAKNNLLQDFCRMGVQVVLGQSLDLRYQNPSTILLQKIAKLKTSPLIEVSLKLGLEPHSPSKEEREHLQILGEALGLGFQIQDDLDDLVLEEEQRETLIKAWQSEFKKAEKALHFFEHPKTLLDILSWLHQKIIQKEKK